MPSTIKNSHEDRLFDIILGQNEKKPHQGTKLNPSKVDEIQKFAANYSDELLSDLERKIEPEIEKIEKDLEVELSKRDEALAHIEYVRP
jgi:hypothetical protein